MPEYDELLDFVKSKGHASCTEIRTRFKLSYAEAVACIDALEEQGAVEPLLLDENNEHLPPKPGPRKLMTPAFKASLEKHERDRKKKQELMKQERERAKSPVKAVAAVTPTKPKKSLAKVNKVEENSVPDEQVPAGAKNS